MAASDTSTKSATNDVRTRLAQVVEIAFTLIAAFLVLAAILVSLRDNINADNPLVEFVKGIANTFDGPFSRKDGVYASDSQKHGVTINALINWGLAAAVYLVVGRIAGRIIRP